MKNILFFIFVGFLVSCQTKNSVKEVNSSSKAKFSSIQSLKKYEDHPILFYNVENLFDTIDDPQKNDDEFTPEGSKKWDTKRYNDKLSKLSSVLTTPNTNNPLFIGLAEVENRFVVLDLIQTGKLANTKYRIAHFDSPDRRGIDVAFAFDLERFFLMHSEAIPILIEGDNDYKTRDILYVKGMLKDSVELHVFVNHWSSRRGGQKESEYKRVLAAETLKNKSDSLLAINPNTNIIFMGDFNDYPNDVSIAETLGAKSIHESGSNEFSNLLVPQHNAGKGTHNYRGKWGALDQIIISPSLKERNSLGVKGNEAFILHEDFLLYEHPSGEKTPSKTYGGSNYYGGYSDHLAIYFYFQKPIN